LLAVCEVIYRPQEFVSTTPHWVVDKLDWVVTRYLAVQTIDASAAAGRPGGNMNILASSLEVIQAAPIAAPRAASPIDPTGTAAADDGVESALESGLCGMFPQFEPAMIQSVLLSVDGDTDEAVLVLSGMHGHGGAAAAAADGGSPDGGKRAREESIDLTGGSDEDGETASAAAAPSAKRAKQSEPAAAAAAAAVSDEPAAHLVEEVLSGTAMMGLELDRDAAIRLLKSHHCHASDAIAAAFG
jgi:hypothetical protein